jgi:predicted transcriptional regulator
MLIDEDDYLAHYGILRRSGRYPYGSGGNESGSQYPWNNEPDDYSMSQSFLKIVGDLHKQGLSDTEIIKALDIPSTTALRAARSIAKNEVRQSNVAMAVRLKEKQMSNTAIGERMGIPESTVRAYLSDHAKEKEDILQITATMLREEVDSKTFVDVGKGVENHLNLSATKLNTAVAVLREQGYELHDLKIPQLGSNNQYTNFKVLCPPGTTRLDVFKNRENIKQISMVSDDAGRSFYDPSKIDPLIVDPKRVGVRYKEDGGDQADGVIYVRPGVKDVSLGPTSKYAQVRIAVGDNHYLKGMAIYKDDLPAGTDLLFNTNKSDTGNKLDAMKKRSDTSDGRFGADTRPLFDYTSDGKRKAYSAMNIVNEEGDWDTWSKSLSTQMLSKQSPSLAKSQLDLTYEQRIGEYERIKSLTNPTIKKKLMEEFADETDSAAVHLKAASLPRQRTQVILPLSTLKSTEVYAPNFKNGERVVLIRYPHGGTFEIPELTVNNRHAEGRKIIGPEARDAIGISKDTAERLSGADFDGDTVLVIPNNGGRRSVISTPALERLNGFDPRAEYKGYEGMPKMSPKTKGLQMGLVSNLITDMTIKQAPVSEIVRAVRHSMVVIDAEKHNLDYKRSAIDHGIADLKNKYQGGATGGASTLISRATSQTRVLDRKLRPAAEGGNIDKETGEKVYVETGAVKKNRKGELEPKYIKSEKLAEAKDARDLSSGTPIERLYADHSNRLKKLANEARLEAVKTPPLKYSPSAKKVFAPQVESLNSKLNLALRNAPLERQAQVVANAIYRAKRDDKPDLDDDQVKKLKAQALNEARTRLNAKKQQIEITDDEWLAIQAGAISNHKLMEILANSDTEIVRQHATPREQYLMTSPRTARARQMLASGYTRAEVAEALGVSITTLDQATIGEGPGE